MNAVETYPETLMFRVYHRGTARQHTALIPSDLDIALLNAQVAQQVQELERVEQQPAPRHVQALLDKREQGDTLDEVDIQTILAYEGGRITEQDVWGAALYRTRKRLEEAIKQLESAEQDQGSQDLVVRTFVMRDFTYRERLTAENNHSTLTPGTGQRQVLVAERNLELLGLCLQHETLPDGRQVTIQDPASLPSKIAQVLIDRMWARADMSPELAQHFRSGS